MLLDRKLKNYKYFKKICLGMHCKNIKIDCMCICLKIGKFYFIGIICHSYMYVNMAVLYFIIESLVPIEHLKNTNVYCKNLLNVNLFGYKSRYKIYS